MLSSLMALSIAVPLGVAVALFLAEFVTVENWAHVDIAGPAFLDSGLMHLPAGGTGTMVRTLVRWIESLEG